MTTEEAPTVFSAHARDMLEERGIPEKWAWRALQTPDTVEFGADLNWHYFRAIEENGARVLHVVVNRITEPNRIVTLFFDRRLRGRL